MGIQIEFLAATNDRVQVVMIIKVQRRDLTAISNPATSVKGEGVRVFICVMA
jgi:hypothetical protein